MEDRGHWGRRPEQSIGRGRTKCARVLKRLISSLRCSATNLCRAWRTHNTAHTPVYGSDDKQHTKSTTYFRFNAHIAPLAGKQNTTSPTPHGAPKPSQENRIVVEDKETMKGATALRPPRSANNLLSHTQPRTPPGTEQDAQQCARCYTTPFTPLYLYCPCGGGTGRKVRRGPYTCPQPHSSRNTPLNLTLKVWRFGTSTLSLSLSLSLSLADLCLSDGQFAVVFLCLTMNECHGNYGNTCSNMCYQYVSYRQHDDLRRP